MTDLRSVLDRQLGELPPSTVDVRAIVAAQRRGTLLRRVAAGTAAAGVVTATAVAVSALPGTGAPAAGQIGPVAGPARTTPVCAGPTPVAPSPYLDPSSSAVATAAPPTGPRLPVGAERDLTAALTAAARPETRGLRLGSLADGANTHRPLEFYGGPCAAEGADMYYAFATLAKPGGARLGLLLVYVQLSKESLCVPAECTVDRRADGTVVRTKTQWGDLQGQQQVRATVVVEKPDGTVVQVLATGPLHGKPALTIAALTRIGLHPGLTLDR